MNFFINTAPSCNRNNQGQRADRQTGAQLTYVAVHTWRVTVRKGRGGACEHGALRLHDGAGRLAHKDFIGAIFEQLRLQLWTKTENSPLLAE